MDRYEDEGLQGLIAKRLEQVSPRKAPVDEVMALVDRYRGRHPGWNVKHFHAWYRKEGGTRSYTWVKERLQEAGEVEKASARGKHRKRRERAAWPGMLLHQDASTHEWVPGVKWDLVVTMDDATNEHYAMRCVEEEGTASSLLGVRDVSERRGLFAARYTDRGSHYWHTPEAGGQVDKRNPTPFGKAMARLGIEMIAAYSPEARGRSERMFRTHQGRLVQELTLAGITDRQGANGYLEEVYRPAFNAQFMQPALEEGSACVPWIGGDLDDFLCETDERVVGKDNGVAFEGMALQIPQDRHRMHDVKVKVRVHRYPDGRLALCHGPRCLVHFDAKGRLIPPKIQAVA